MDKSTPKATAHLGDTHSPPNGKQHQRARAQVFQQKTQRPVKFEIAATTRESVAQWVSDVQLKSWEYLFPSRVGIVGEDRNLYLHDDSPPLPRRSTEADFPVELAKIDANDPKRSWKFLSML